MWLFIITIIKIALHTYFSSSFTIVGGWEVRVLSKYCLSIEANINVTSLCELSHEEVMERFIYLCEMHEEDQIKTPDDVEKTRLYVTKIFESNSSGIPQVLSSPRYKDFKKEAHNNIISSYREKYESI